MRNSILTAWPVAVVLLVAVSLPTHSSTSSSQEDALKGDHVQVVFAPEHDCLGALLKGVRAAKQSLKVQMNDLASDALARELVAARERGVFLRILLGANATPEISPAARPLLEKDHLVRVDVRPYTHHHVTVIVDDALVLNGVVQTRNHPDAAAVQQHVVLIQHEPEIANQFVRQWMKCAEKSRLFHEVTLSSPGTTENTTSASPLPLAGPENTSPSKPTATPKAEMVYVTSSGKRYHAESCRYASSGKPLTVKEAIAQGKTPCKLCKPDRK